MKKIISIALAAIMILSALALTACGGGGSDADLSESKYVGTWKVADISLADESEEIDKDWIMTLNGDGTGTLDSGEGEVTDFTWELTSDGFKTKGDMKLTFKDDGDRIVAKILGADLAFVKQ